MRALSFVATALLAVLFVVPGVAMADPPAQEVVIKVDGMFCPFCTFGIEKRLNQLPEAAKVRTDLAAGEAIVTLKPGAEFVKDHYADAIERAGFSQSGITLRAGEPAAPASAPTSAPVTSRAAPPAAPQGTDTFRYSRTLGGPGAKLGRFDQPMSLAFGPDGWFVVTDSGNKRVQQFHANGRPWRQWSVSGDGKTPLANPVGLAIGPTGDIWVTDYEADTVSHYDATGTPLGLFGRSGQGDGEFDAPSDVAITPDGLVALADFYNHRVQLFTADGRFVRALGTQGLLRRLSPSGLNYPTRVTAAPDGVLWVADAYNHRVVAFDARGGLVRRFGKKGRKPGRFDVSAGIALLPNNRLAVADFMNHRIQVWTRAGEYVTAFGHQGSRPGAFERPTDVVLSPDGSLYIVDWGNNRVQVFEQVGTR